jgi:hypothetical protein
MGITGADQKVYIFQNDSMLKYGKGIVLFLHLAPSIPSYCSPKIPIVQNVHIPHTFANLAGLLLVPLQGEIIHDTGKVEP